MFKTGKKDKYYRRTVKNVEYFIFLLQEAISKVALIDFWSFKVKPLLDGHLLYDKESAARNQLNCPKIQYIVRRPRNNRVSAQ